MDSSTIIVPDDRVDKATWRQRQPEVQGYRSYEEFSEGLAYRSPILPDGSIGLREYMIY